jgi:hypothetical protein
MVAEIVIRRLISTGPPYNAAIVIEDVFTSGAHFKAARARLCEEAPASINAGRSFFSFPTALSSFHAPREVESADTNPYDRIHDRHI